MVRILPGNIVSTLGSIREIWKSVNPAYPFEFNFFDAEFERSYRAETRLAGMIESYAVIGIFIACLGLFGLASFTAEQRTKEIGIRKVLGATIPGVAKLLSKEFIILVLISNSLAWPISYYIMNGWLQSFAYRTHINLWTLLMPALIALVFTVLTVSYQAIKAALANPVDALRYE
jgi:putative ABC transport system permease protein